MPFGPDEVLINLTCGRGAGGHWWGWYSIRVRADRLRTLGLHPDQPTSRIVGPSPPALWHAEAELLCR